ncbi:mitochondrial carrier domain-containing protein [Crassisporium funariophilum]|nr:mitochondrial carrier domain-containing protein [Crassisporium funariophilum]
MTSTLPPLVQAFSGAIGSASANALTYPLDLIATCLQLDPPRKRKQRGGIHGAVLIFKHILRNYGIGALYDGLWPDTVATFLSNFLYFYFYSFLRSLSTRRLISFRNTARIKKPGTISAHKPTILEELFLGFIAGVASRAITTPLNIITFRLQTEREDEEDAGAEQANPKGITDIVNLIFLEQGLAGFWRGFQTTTILSLNPSITLAFFQMFRRILTLVKSSGSGLQIEKTSLPHSAAADVNPKPSEAFFGAATSNSIAVTLLYPLILAKTRLQASSATTMREVLVDAYRGVDSLASKHSLDKGKGVQSGERMITGIGGLYQGLEMQIIKGFLSQGVTFLVKGRIEQLIVAAYLRRMNRI